MPSPESRLTARYARLLAAAATVLLAVVASAFPEALQLERAAMVRGEVWRLWTGHLVHASRDHLVYDAGAAALMFLALEGPGRQAKRLLWMAPVISLTLLCALPDLGFYYGLSGLLHGWAVASSGTLWKNERGPMATLAGAFCVGTIAKAAWETWSGTTSFSSHLDLGGSVIYAAHLVGAIIGLFHTCTVPGTNPPHSAIAAGTATIQDRPGHQL